jgi:hypothetical protein
VLNSHLVASPNASQNPDNTPKTSYQLIDVFGAAAYWKVDRYLPVKTESNVIWVQLPAHHQPSAGSTKCIYKLNNGLWKYQADLRLTPDSKDKDPSLKGR